MQKFSIILPLYNGGDYAKQCVNSVLGQSLNDFNLLVLDNNSTDGTLDWIVALNDPRIVIYQSYVNLGITGNWARIKDLPRNEYMTIIGHDDIFCSGYLQEMDRLIAAHPNASLYQTHFDFIDSKGRVLRSCQPMAERQEGHEFLASQLTLSLDSMGTGYMMRSRDFDFLGGMPTTYPNLIFADYQLWMQLTLLSYKATSAFKGFQYRLHDSTSKTTNGYDYQLAFEKYVLFIASLTKQNKDVASVVKLYGRDYLMFFCESLSHRLLKTPRRLRKISVKDFINKCRHYASLWVPEQRFEPMNKIKINVAAKLDSFAFSRELFNLYKKISS